MTKVKNGEAEVNQKIHNTFPSWEQSGSFGATESVLLRDVIKGVRDFSAQQMKPAIIRIT